jgi:hypothetical protein
MRWGTCPFFKPLCERLGHRASLKLLEEADHSFHVPARSGRTDADVRREVLESLADWIGSVSGGG